MRRHIAADPEAFLGKVAGNGQCAVLVEMLAPELGLTKHWRAGPRVLDVQDIAAGTVIATFDEDGLYGNHTDGRSHAAVWISPSKDGGFLVIDQWVGHPCAYRTIHPGHHPPVNDAMAYYVVETEERSPEEHREEALRRIDEHVTEVLPQVPAEAAPDLDAALKTARAAVEVAVDIASIVAPVHGIISVVALLTGQRR